MDEVLPPCLSPAERGRNLQDKDTLNATLDLHQPRQDSLQPFFLCSVVGHLPKTQLTAFLGPDAGSQTMVVSLMPVSSIQPSTGCILSSLQAPPQPLNPPLTITCSSQHPPCPKLG